MADHMSFAQKLLALGGGGMGGLLGGLNLHTLYVRGKAQSAKPDDKDENRPDPGAAGEISP
jgi:hypothetical protein